MKGLSPLDPVLPVCEKIENEENDMVIVGRLPFLDHLAAFLLNGDETKEILSFTEGGMVCLERCTVLFSSLSSRASVSIIIVIDSPILRVIKKNSLFQFREETFDNIAN
jgi:phosphohistidine phosphatase SixA